MYAKPKSTDALWVAAGKLVDKAESLDALRAHRLQFLALCLWTEQNRPVPSELIDEARRAAVTTVAANAILKRARAAYDGALLLMKGAEVAARYPQSTARFFRDIDLLADDAAAAQRALIKSGFAEVETIHDYAGDDHLCPLTLPGSLLHVEIHRQPSSPTYLSSPSADEVFASSVPSLTGIAGLRAPSPAMHAVLLVGHAWTHQPLGRVSDLIDMAAVLPGDQRTEATAIAQSWGWERMWTAALHAADSLLEGHEPTLPLRTWARHLAQVREPSVLESHWAQVAAPAAALPPSRAPRGVIWALRDLLGPGPDEHWGAKLYRSTRAMRHPLQIKSRHDRRVGRNPWSR